MLVARRPLPPLVLPRHAAPAPMAERLRQARERIRRAALANERIVSYEIALDLDMSEFYFARQFRAAFGRSPHEHYNEVRAERARVLLRDGNDDAVVARLLGMRKISDLRALLAKFPEADAAE